MENATIQQLAQSIAEHMRQATPQPQQGPVQQAVQGPYGLPQPVIGLGFGPQFAPQSMGPFPQPTGVSVAVSVPLPDGRDVSMRVHFGPEAAANLQQFAALCAQMFGQYLAAKAPRYSSTGWNGYSYSPYRRR